MSKGGKKKRSTAGLILDVVLTLCTGGLWLIWILIRYLRKIYKITLGDGTEISNLKLNGNNFISTEKIEESAFADNCSPVTISDGTTETVHPNMELVQIVEQVPGEYWFVLRDISEEEFARTKMQSDIAYIAMMSNVEL